MDDDPCRRFFLEPTQPMHRRYAALRAFFIDGLLPQAIAERFGLPYHTVRSWIRDFRAQCRAGQRPPFLPSHAVDGHAAELPRSNRHDQPTQRRPIADASA
jgi:transposase